MGHGQTGRRVPADSERGSEDGVGLTPSWRHRRRGVVPASHNRANPHAPRQTEHTHALTTARTTNHGWRRFPEATGAPSATNSAAAEEHRRRPRNPKRNREEKREGRKLSSPRVRWRHWRGRGRLEVAGIVTATVGRQRGRQERHGQLRQPPDDSSRQEMKERTAKAMKQTARRGELCLGRIDHEPIRARVRFGGEKFRERERFSESREM